jgi:transcriptional regulator with XRE-family HTH domain
MKEMPDNSVDSIVTDPPYELGFMGKSWDATGIAFNVQVWQEALRVLKPGGHLIAFSGSRTYHRMAVAIEDAGFEIRDQIMWVYGSGFPKSHDISKGIDKQNGKHERDLQPFADYVKQCRKLKGWSLAQLDEVMGTNTAASWWEGRKSGIQPPHLDTYKQLKIVLEMDNRFDELIDWLEAEREVVGTKMGLKSVDGNGHGIVPGGINVAVELDITAPATAAAKQWQGWGTALKPAHEPMVLARKPLIGTVANNVLTYGTGGLNIDGSRVGGGGGLN